MADQYPPQPPAPPPPPSEPETPAKRKRRRWPWIVAGVVVLIIIIAAVAGGGDDDETTAGDETTTTAEPAEETTEAPTTTAAPETTEAPGIDVAGEPDEVDDVVLDNCENAAGIELATARGRITNDSSEPSNYLLEFNVLDPAGTVVGSGIGAVNDVQPDSQVTWEGTSDVGLPEGGTCQLSSVDRLAA
jgi:hypothetical protein